MAARMESTVCYVTQKYMSLQKLIFLLFFVFFAAQANSQERVFVGSAIDQIQFYAHPNQLFGLDAFEGNQFEEQPVVYTGENEYRYVVPFKSISDVVGDSVLAEIYSIFEIDSTLTFLLSSDSSKLNFRFYDETTVVIYLPPSSTNYEVLAYQNERFLGQLNVLSYPEIKYSIELISCVTDSSKVAQIQAEINAFFKPANVQFSLVSKAAFPSPFCNDSLLLERRVDPDYQQYSMDEFRISSSYPNTPASDFRFFVIAGYKDSLQHGFMGIGKQIGFVVNDSVHLAEHICLELARGLAHLKNFQFQSADASDSLHQFELSYVDWEKLRIDPEMHVQLLESEKRQGVGAVTAYYFWEENDKGQLIPNTFTKPYRRNYIIRLKEKTTVSSNLNRTNVKLAVDQFTHDNSNVTQKSSFEIKPVKGKFEKVNLPLQKTVSTDLGSVIYRMKDGKWESMNVRNVLYFNLFDDSIRVFSHANDSIILPLYNVKLKANGHYTIKTFWDKKGKIRKQEVYAYNGEDVSAFFKQKSKIIPKRVLVFSNGYRGPDKNSDVSDNLVTTSDRYHYWMKIDDEFIKRFNPFQSYYIDGSHGISTSAHKNMANFGLSISIAKTIARSDDYSVLNTERNVDGFNERREKGKIAGKSFLSERCNSPACIETKDTVDIVCHSMGYAYALGFIDAISDRVILGKAYILAPENACVGGTDWSQFQEVWQYGSNLDQRDPDPVWEQDGIAPQCEVAGLEKLNSKQGGRAFIPKDWPHKSFIDSHMLAYFNWIFDRIKPGENGYVFK